MNEVFWKATGREMFEFFLSMSDEEAQAFFEQYLRLRDQRLALLNRTFLQTGGEDQDDLSFDPDSLPSLWSWATSRLRRREHTAAELEHIMSLPEWFREHHLANRPLSEDSLILINDIAYYLAETLIRNLKGVHWEVCKTKVNRFVDENQPVLGGFTIPLNPRDTVRAAALKTLDGEAGEDALLQVYEQCYNLLPGPAN